MKSPQSYLGFLDQNDGRVHLERVEWQNSDTIVDALINFALQHQGKRIIVVWDNAGWHQSKKLREQLAANQTLSRVHLINMPPYAPDPNPIEHVWGEAKTQIANLQRDTFDQTRGWAPSPSSAATSAMVRPESITIPATSQAILGGKLTALPRRLLVPCANDNTVPPDHAAPLHQVSEKTG